MKRNKRNVMPFVLQQRPIHKFLAFRLDLFFIFHVILLTLIDIKIQSRQYQVLCTLWVQPYFLLFHVIVIFIQPLDIWPATKASAAKIKQQRINRNIRFGALLLHQIQHRLHTLPSLFVLKRVFPAISLDRFQTHGKHSRCRIRPFGVIYHLLQHIQTRFTIRYRSIYVHQRAKQSNIRSALQNFKGLLEQFLRHFDQRMVAFFHTLRDPG
mmetsp:Transcript_40421/g.64813  ORF Transcript_40421/g.64813 Transcript_40421/m.64813 type:complete len:211 (+) Transcript_40421:254-886(+)